MRIVKKLCKKDIHRGFVARYETAVGAFLNIFIRVLRGKNTWFPNFVATGGWKGLTNESSGFKAKESGWLRDVYKDKYSTLRK